MDRDRLLVLDADLPRRLATWLESRKRKAVPTSALGLNELADALLLRELAERYGSSSWVLVTGDDAMPAEHGPVIWETRATIATINPRRPPSVPEHHWRVDVVHRWAHSMQRQEPQTVRRYSLNESHPWKPRRRHIQRIARHDWEPWTPSARSAPDTRAGDQQATAPPESYPQDPFPGIG